MLNSVNPLQASFSKKMLQNNNPEKGVEVIVAGEANVNCSFQERLLFFKCSRYCVFLFLFFRLLCSLRFLSRS